MSSATPSAQQFLLGVAAWGSSSNPPTVDVPNAASGSMWHRAGTYPATPAEIFLRVGPGSGTWCKQNLVNLSIYNIKTYGAVGDGVNDDTAAINSAVAAANTAGGGIVYFPPVNVAGGQAYRVTKPASNFGSILLNNVSNIVFLGDGFASKISMIGNSGGGTWHMFRIINGSTNLRFINLNLDGAGITNPDPGGQNHILLVGDTTMTAAVGNIEITGIWFGNGVGDNIALRGTSTAFATFNIRMHDNNHSGSCRTPISDQRYLKRNQVYRNYLSGSLTGQEIDFEPTGGTSNDAAPERYLITCNHINHASSNAQGVTLSGVSTTFPSQRNVFAYNTMTNGGNIQAVHASNLVIRGNIVQMNASTNASALIDIENDMTDFIVTGNVVVSETDVALRYGIKFQSTAATQLDTAVCCDNVAAVGSSDAVNGIVGIFLGKVIRVACKGNVIQHTLVGAAGKGVGIQAINLDNQLGIDDIVISGNMIIDTVANRLDSAINVHPQSGINCGMVGVSYNVGDHCLVCVRWDRGTTETFTKWRACNNNLGIDMSSNMVSPPPDNSGVSGDGQAAPGAQIVVTGATPVANVNAPVGALASNQAGSGAGNIIFYKETASGVSGGTAGWLGMGGSEIQFGALAGSTATANRFFAPGGLGLAAETTVEIQFAVPRPLKLRLARLNCTAGTGGGNNTYRIRKNAVDAALQFTIANTATSGSDVANSLSVVAGDQISWRVSKSLAPATAQTNIIINMEAA